MKKFLILLLLIAAGAGLWFYYSGTLDEVTEARVNAALVDAGAPPELADCMAPKMVDELSLIQLKKLERLRAEDGESAVPLSPRQLIERVQRVDDSEALQTTVFAAGTCAFGSLIN